ncbi:MAG: hypothetical protein V1758_00210 [Pseudomonadota bacterium]
MDEEEYQNKYLNLRILKSVQEYLKADTNSSTAVYPMRIPDDLLYQVLKLQGPDKVDKVVHHIFKLGLAVWSEKLYSEVFGSQETLEDFIEVMKKRTKE